MEMIVAGATARATAEITGVNRNTIRLFYQRLRTLIASKLPCYELSGEVEAEMRATLAGCAKASEAGVPLPK